MVVLLRSDVVPHAAAHETHQQPQKISFPTPKDFFNSIDPNRTFITQEKDFIGSKVSDAAPLASAKPAHAGSHPGLD